MYPCKIIYSPWKLSRSFYTRSQISLDFNIIPYTYEPQSEALMRDIRNYRETLQLIRSIYRNFHIITHEEEEPEDQNWLINDLFGFGNNGIPTGHAYIDHFRHIWFSPLCY